MHCDMLAENIVVADAHARRFGFIFQILRHVADHAARVKLIVRTNLRDAGQINVRPHDAMRAEFYTRVNHGIRADADGRVQLRLRMDDGRRMNHFAAIDSHRFKPMENKIEAADLRNLCGQKLSVKIPQFAQRRIIFRPLRRGAADDDVIHHLDLQ